MSKELQTESPYGETPADDAACADCGRYTVLVGPITFDGEVVDHGDFVCILCAARRGIEIERTQIL